MKKTILILTILIVSISLISAKNTGQNFAPYLEQQENPKLSEKEISEEYPVQKTQIKQEANVEESKTTQELDFKVSALPYEKNRITKPLLIERSIFEDDFETDKGWTFNGEWERDIPSGLYYDPPAGSHGRSGR